MKVVLRQDVSTLGDAGTVHQVAAGYARNYLIPQGLAVIATAGEVKVAEHNQAVAQRKIVKQEQALQTTADRINGQRLEFTARSGVGGRLYGSITAGDVAERLSAAIGEEIDRRRVVLEDPIRSVGEHNVTVHLVGRLRPQVTVIVHGEMDEEAEAEAAEASAAADAASDDESIQKQTRERAESGTGSSGHPEPGSGHDDSKTETVADGPDTPRIDGVPGAFGEVEVRHAEDEASTHGAGSEVDRETSS